MSTRNTPSDSWHEWVVPVVHKVPSPFNASCTNLPDPSFTPHPLYPNRLTSIRYVTDEEETRTSGDECTTPQEWVRGTSSPVISRRGWQWRRVSPQREDDRRRKVRLPLQESRGDPLRKSGTLRPLVNRPTPTRTPGVCHN